MSEYNKKIQFINQMNSSKPFNISKLSDLIKNLHNHDKFDLTQQFGSIIPTHLQLATLSVLNLQINQSLDFLNQQSQKPPAYFERQIFVINNSLRKVGHIVKIISSLCSFKDSRQQSLANFQTVNFYQSNSLTNEFPPRFLNFLKGIFPSINVHKDNIPLYMPFYDKLESYHSNIGNPNWEISRANLDFVYLNEIIGPEEMEDNWYLLLTGNKKILQVYNKTSIEQVWVCMYLFYLNSTLKPYRCVTLKEENSEQINHDKVIGVIQKTIEAQTNKEVKHLLVLILYVITDNTDQLEKSFQIFKEQFKTHIQKSENDQQSKIICSEWGLINAFYCQLLHNVLDHMVQQGFEDPTEYRKLQTLLNECTSLTEDLVEKAIRYYDFYLRVCRSSNTKDKLKLKNTHDYILPILRNSMKKNTNGFPFPEYGFWENDILEPFSAQYLQRFPEKIIQIINYLPKEIAIWKLLKCEKLSNSDEFQRIRQCLQKNEKLYIEQIKKVIRISQTDYDEFLRLWTDYHHIIASSNCLCDFESQMQRVQEGKQKLSQMLKVNMIPQFREKVYLPFIKSQNILTITNALIQGYEQLLPDLNQSQRQSLLHEYLSILLDAKINKELISAFSEEDATQFWKKWSLVYMTDQNLVDELIKCNDSQQIIPSMAQGIEEEERDHQQPNEPELMQIQQKQSTFQII